MPNRASNVHRMSLDLESKVGGKCTGYDTSMSSDKLHFFMDNGDVYTNEENKWELVVKGRTIMQSITKLCSFFLLKK